MAASRLGSADFRARRRWTFAGCTFDEANWTLAVGGRRVAVETKPLELLRVLLLRAGDLVSKDELLDAVWPDVAVVEASLPTAVRKLRCALDDDERATPIIETVPRIGYRLAVPVKVEDLSGAAMAPMLTAPPADMPALPAIAAAPAGATHSSLALRLLSISGAIAIALAAIAVATTPSQDASASRASVAKPGAQPADASRVSQRAVEEAIRKLDIEAVERMLAAGWDPATPWDQEGNDALTMVLNHCEWDPAHDRRQMLLMARTLIEGGVKIDKRNVFGDTPYSIAKAPRYCGPDHPVTQMLEAMCYGGDMGPKDRCLATYELNAEQRRAQGLPPKA